MILSRLISTSTGPFQKPAALLCMMALAVVHPANAAPPPKNPKAAPAAMIIPPAPVISTVLSERSSRYISPEELQTYVQAVSLTFSIKTRSTDPFGQQQNPDAKPVFKPTTAKPIRSATLPSQIKPFAEIIRSIHVTTVMPAEQRFLVGTQSFKKGDRFPLKYRERTIKVEVTTVNSREITFRNLDNDESASLKLSLMPPGMSLGNGNITAPGMVPENANPTLEIDPAS